MDCCPACQRPFDDRPEGPRQHAGAKGAERIAALVKDLGTDGVTYPEAAVFLGRSVKRIQNLVYEHGLEVRYRRIGRHPRRRAFLMPSTIRALKRLLPQSQPSL